MLLGGLGDWVALQVQVSKTALHWTPFLGCIPLKESQGACLMRDVGHILSASWHLQHVHWQDGMSWDTKLSEHV